jgi:hypothetical protein
MARSDVVWIFGAVGFAASLVACSDLLGLGDYTTCSDACDAGTAETGTLADAGADAFDAPPPVDAMTFEAGDVAAIDAALYWVHWPMPNPNEIAEAGGLPNPSSYASVEDAGVVVDLVTSLRWQTMTMRTTDVASATTFCTSFGSGWRLPTRIELVSLIDFTQQNPAIDATFIVNDGGAEISDTFWTASAAWVVDFSTGEVRTNIQANVVRCVAAGGS